MNKRTSFIHPLQIAAVSAGSEFGRIGLTLCPGKCDPNAMSGAWDRDLAADLDAIRDWGAAAVVTLLEPQELALLRVQHLGKEVMRRDMSWFHLPIADARTPDDDFELTWESAGAALDVAKWIGRVGPLSRWPRARRNDPSATVGGTRYGASDGDRNGTRSEARCHRDP